MIALRKLALFGFAGGILLLAGTANAATLPLFSTGFNTTEGTVDTRWILTGTNPGGYGPGLKVAQTGSYPLTNGTWLANTSTSKWLVPAAVTQDNHAASSTVFYDYTTTFSMAGFNPATGSLNFQYAVDNGLEDVIFNGVSLKTAPYNFNFSSSSFTSFSNTYTVNGGFTTGTNTLIFRVSNATGSTTQNPVGLNVILSGSAATIPEGNTALLAGLAVPFLGVLVARRRKK